MSNVITYEDLKAHSKKDSLWVLLHGKVYDVTKFIDEHPGGDEVIMSEAGKDATEAFEDVGHSDEARDLLPGMLVGEFEQDGLKIKSTSSASSHTADRAVQQTSNAMYFLPLTVLAAYFAWRFYSS
ncbi:cytochrome b5 [Vararia minispora EC-137]|uniref:Cytochrome b5 n=1 Tax=Vararia minispora EC-137 TaxID=1314806 RepID=A0ACB8QQG8_9AGAM|nr:cytochrome b5 [Vararia minispora EC-137]